MKLASVSAYPLIQLAFLSLLASCGTGVADEAARRVVPLFDGKTLRGWEGDARYWRVEKGAIVGEIAPGTRLDHNTWLIWRDGTLRDFDLRMQVKLTGAPAANSGIQFRCQARGIDHVSGYQADLDQGAVWLGRIYDEHGRALIVERGTRVSIAEDGKRRVEPFAPAAAYRVLFRPGEWNDYRIVAVGSHIAVYINGTLFSELSDRQHGESDLAGQLALQLHAGPETRVEFRNIELEQLEPHDSRLGSFRFRRPQPAESHEEGELPKDAGGRELNLGFESGSLADWTTTGDAFRGQPVARDGIAQRWPGQRSRKVGRWFIGGYEVVRDGGTGTLTSAWFSVTQPFASFLIGGGSLPETRVEILVKRDRGNDQKPRVLATFHGRNREQMHREVVDLRKIQGQQIAVRLVDETRGGWGHLNFDDFRFHRRRPAFATRPAGERTSFNPILQHLQRQTRRGGNSAAAATVGSMYVPPGFSVEAVASEPRVHQPIAFTFDARGRLWIAEAHSYPQKRPEGKGLDRIVILADRDGDGRFEQRKVFIEGLNLVSGLEVGFGGVWVGAAPQLLFIPDRDDDDRPDSPPQVLLDGFGFADTHETLNNFLWGPDGWLYGNQGVFNSSRIGKPGTPDSERVSLAAGVWRYHPTTHRFEVFAHGGSNQWGLDYDELGELWMTHCRSRWGGGATTHVVQGGHYWNQVNRGYAPYISSSSLPDRPWMKNYLSATARYGHGEGGAGRPGTRAVFGGHAHVGTMIYLGDNWPARYRNHLFTHNLHGHQINHQINRRDGSGYQTVHAGEDMLLCTDPTYVAVDLKVGPDGAVYLSDWSDRRHCHNPNEELWDRSNGRIYRLQYDATYRPVSVNYDEATDDRLAEAQTHPNAWHARMARLVLAERAAQGHELAESAASRLRALALHGDEARIRLRALWALHLSGVANRELLERLMADSSEYVRGWVVTLAKDDLELPQAETLWRQAARDGSLWVRRRLASILPQLPPALAWQVGETLASQPENSSDPVLPKLIWSGMAPLVASDFERALKLAERTSLVELRDYIGWYAAKASDASRQVVIARMAQAEGKERRRWLELIALATAGMRGLPVPAEWEKINGSLYDDTDPRIARAARTIGAAMGDRRLYVRMRAVLSGGSATPSERREAIEILAADRSPENVPHFLRLLDRPRFARRVVPLLARYDRMEIADALLERLPGWPAPMQAAALEVLSGRGVWANRLLDRIADGAIDRKLLTAFYVRQMASLHDEKLNRRLAQEWGSLSKTSAEKEQAIEDLVDRFTKAPLWAFDAGAGKEHFTRLCASCHDPPKPERPVAPAINGIRSKGIRYLVENVIDPNAVIGKDYRSILYVMADGRVITGLPERTTESAITIRTANGTVVVATSDIEATKVSENSLMPEGLLDPLNDRQRIELLKYLMTR